MASSAYLRLRGFRLPLLVKAAIKLSALLTAGRLKASYEERSGSVTISASFHGAMLDRALRLSKLVLREWCRQRAPEAGVCSKLFK